jgi:hypothetical protein
MWTWKGQETTLVELGDPTATTPYRFCLYDGGTDVLVDLGAPAGGACGTRPCWKASSKGFGYKNTLGTTAGLTEISLKSGATGKAALKVKAKGASLGMPALPLIQTPNPVRVVLTNEASGVCWEALFSAPPKNPSSTVKWTVKND